MAITMKAARVNAGYTQEKAAKALQINRNTLRSYENLKTVPKVDIGQRIAQLYGLEVDDIIFFKQ